ISLIRRFLYLTLMTALNLLSTFLSGCAGGGFFGPAPGPFPGFGPPPWRALSSVAEAGSVSIPTPAPAIPTISSTAVAFFVFAGNLSFGPPPIGTARWAAPAVAAPPAATSAAAWVVDTIRAAGTDAEAALSARVAVSAAPGMVRPRRAKRPASILRAV